jgi:type IV secretion system protein TrbI
MAHEEQTPGTAPVVDRRPVPRGVLPKGVQTWLMVSIAAAMLLIILLTGHRDPATPSRQGVPGGSAPSSPDRVRDYQERLRLLDEQAAREAREALTQQAPAPTSRSAADDGDKKPVDPLADERRRREYESLFASNVVMSRRPQGHRPDGDATRTTAAVGTDLRREVGAPSLDEIAAAVVRASGPMATAGAIAQPRAAEGSASPTTPSSKSSELSQPIDATARVQRLLEGTVIDAVLTNRLDGAAAAPVVCLVTNAIYSHSGQQVLIPAGAKVVGETRPVQSLGETRLAVGFHRILMPDGSSVGIEQFRGLNQIGDSGLRDRVNHHYLSTFGAAGAVGLISGLSQLLATAGMGIGDGDRTVVVAGNVADGANQASSQVMNRFLNRLPTITIREGHRLKIYVTSDLDLPVWRPAVASLSMNQGGA